MPIGFNVARHKIFENGNEESGMVRSNFVNTVSHDVLRAILVKWEYHASMSSKDIRRAITFHVMSIKLKQYQP